ncbi:capsid protein 1 [Chaphamaparvovirus galliform3]|nr:capsid protein 1 [Chaphamaparvovirus galliform3]
MTETIKFQNVYMTYIDNNPYQYPSINVPNMVQDRIYDAMVVNTGWHIVPNFLWRHCVIPRQWNALVTNCEAYAVKGIKGTIFNPIPITHNISLQRTSLFSAFNNCTYAMTYTDDKYETQWFPWNTLERNKQLHLAQREGLIWTGTQVDATNHTPSRYQWPIYHWSKPNCRNVFDDNWSQGKAGQAGVYDTDATSDLCQKKMLYQMAYFGIHLIVLMKLANYELAKTVLNSHGHQLTVMQENFSILIGWHHILRGQLMDHFKVKADHGHYTKQKIWIQVISVHTDKLCHKIHQEHILNQKNFKIILFQICSTCQKSQLHNFGKKLKIQLKIGTEKHHHNNQERRPGLKNLINIGVEQNMKHVHIHHNNGFAKEYLFTMQETIQLKQQHKYHSEKKSQRRSKTKICILCTNIWTYIWRSTLLSTQQKRHLPTIMHSI